jgi:hypothetical protein
MSKTKMQEVRELIRAGRYNEARDILKAIDHPLAKEWLQKLNKTAPDTRKKNVYAGDDVPTNHPYEPIGNTKSGWLRQAESAQSDMDQRHKDRVEYTKKVMVQERRKWLIIVGVIILVTIPLIQPMYYFITQDSRPVLYFLGFSIFLGLPIRIMAWAGRESHSRPGIVTAVVVVVVISLFIVLIEYAHFLRSVRVYHVTFSGYYLSWFFSEIGARVGFQQFLLLIFASIGVLPTVLMTDERFGNITAGIGGAFLPRWIRDILLKD